MKTATDKSPASAACTLLARARRLAAAAAAAVLFVAATASAATRAAAPTKVLAHASDTDEWVAQVVSVDDHVNPPNEQTRLFDRAVMGGQWVVTDTLADRAVSVANFGPEAAVLQGDGGWALCSSAGGGRIGPPPPPPAKLVAFASDGEALWALADVPGGEAALASTRPAAAGPATSPSTIAELPSTAAATAPTTRLIQSGPAIQPTTAPASRLVLMEFVKGAWVQAGPQLPEAVLAGARGPSLAVAGRQPFVAYTGADGKAAVLSLTSDRAWKSIPVSDPGFAADQYAMLAYGQAPMLWVAGPGDDWGLVYHGKQLEAHTPLKKTGDVASLDGRSITVGGGRMRLVLLAGGKLFEQVYDPGDRDDFAKPVGTLSPVELPAEPQPDMTPWLVGGAAMVALAAVAAAAYRRSAALGPVGALAAQVEDADAEAAGRDEGAADGAGAGRTSGARSGAARSGGVRPGLGEKMPLAPQTPRLAAGAIDALPLLLWFVFVNGPTRPVADVALGDLLALHVLVPLIVAITAYVLHTAVAEVICGASLGKMLFGLRVVAIDGRPARPSRIWIRNALRVVDVFMFPLCLILFSPLRQRVGDLAAGTVVIAENPPEPRDAEAEDE